MTTVAKLLDAVPTLSVKGPQRAEVTGVTCDSRQVRPGFVFVAVAGLRRDGWVFAADAVRRGAVAVVSAHADVLSRDVCHACVENPRRAAAELASAFFGRPADRLILVGITGTNGKTTAAYLVQAILRESGHEPGLVGTVEYRIGERTIPAERTTPEAPALQSMLAQMVGAGCESAVMEVSSHALVQERTHGIAYDVGVFTNLTHDHLDYHGNLEEYFEAKARLFQDLGKGGKRATAVINADDPWGRRLVGRTKAAAVVTYGMGEGAAVQGCDAAVTPSGSRFRARSPWGDVSVRLRLLGRFNVSNALAAVAVCGVLGVDPARAASALERVPAVPGRLERVESAADFAVFVDYAHTDDALSHVLSTVREITPGRVIVVFGCGGNRDRAKRPLMGGVAARLADYSILTSDNPRKEDPAEIIAAIRQGFGADSNVEVVEDRAAAIGRAVAMARSGDSVVIAGKGHENFQEFANTTVPFDDRDVVKQMLGAR